MSQGSARRVNVRAMFAATAVCALIFSLFVSGAMQGAHAAGSMRMAVGAAASCHHLEASAPASSAAQDHHKGGHSGKVDCPFCCLGGACRRRGAAGSPCNFRAAFANSFVAGDVIPLSRRMSRRSLHPTP